MRELMWRAMLAWYEATWRAVPVYTGMARATLLPMGYFLSNMSGVDVSTDIRPKKQERTLDKDVRQYYTHDTRTKEYGEEEALVKQAFKYADDGRKQSFTFDIPVWHWQEFDSEWHAIAQGEIAFWEYVWENRDETRKLLSEGFDKSLLKRKIAVNITGTTKLEKLFEIRGMAERGEL